MNRHLGIGIEASEPIGFQSLHLHRKREREREREREEAQRTRRRGRGEELKRVLIGRKLGRLINIRPVNRVAEGATGGWPAD